MGPRIFMLVKKKKRKKKEKKGESPDGIPSGLKEIARRDLVFRYSSKEVARRDLIFQHWLQGIARWDSKIFC